MVIGPVFIPVRIVIPVELYMSENKQKKKNTKFCTFIEFQKKNSDWRKKRESFIQALRYAKKCAEVEKTGGSIRDITPPPPSENPDYKQCPHCSRKFNPDAAARHIPRCQDLNTRPPQARKGRR